MKFKSISRWGVYLSINVLTLDYNLSISYLRSLVSSCFDSSLVLMGLISFISKLATCDAI